MDESFFLYCEEPDLSSARTPVGLAHDVSSRVTVVHHGGNESSSQRLAAQLAYSQRLYMTKHFSRRSRLFGTGSLALGYALRAVLGARRPASRVALMTLLGLRPEPFPLD